MGKQFLLLFLVFAIAINFVSINSYANNGTTEQINILPSYRVEAAELLEEGQFELNRETLRMKKGEAFQLTTNIANITWESIDDNIVSVSSDGLLTAEDEGYTFVRVSTTAGEEDICVVSVLPAETLYSEHVGNPYLPFYEFVPDAEPYVFDDPDNP